MSTAQHPRCRRAATRGALVLGLLALVGASAPMSPAAADEGWLAESLRMFAEAESEHRIGVALSRVRGGVGPGLAFADTAALADWLGELPPKRAAHPRVLELRGWGYMKARRGAAGIPVLEQALEAEPENGQLLAYLAECLRLEKRYADAAAAIVGSIRAGFDADSHRPGIIFVGMSLRRQVDTARPEGLPAYVEAVRPYLALREDAELHAMLARWLLLDLERLEDPASKRGGLWARTGAEHALFARETAATGIAGLGQLSHDLATALKPQLAVPAARSAAFDLLVGAVQLGAPTSELGTHAHPEALTDLAELALMEHRYELAARMLQARAAIGRTPRLRRLARQLPPDLEGP